MCLWQRVLAFDAEHVRVATDSHRDPGNPLRRGALLPALALVEYGAQAMAVHGGLLAQPLHAATGTPRRGMLVALREVELQCTRLDTLAGEIEGHAVCLAAGADSQQYRFRIEHAGRVIAHGRATVLLQPAGE
ncbi:phosphotransferase [Luteimonas sp. e5]